MLSIYIRNVPLADDEKMVSFYFTFLYTNISITDMLNIKNYGNKGYQFPRKLAVIQKEKFLDLFNLVLKNTWYTINFQFYQKTDCIGMRQPACSTTAETCMCTQNKT